MKQDGWTVESTADAPMRVRAWFESLDDAREFAEVFGDSALILREVRASGRSEAVEAEKQPDAASKNLDELNDTIDDTVEAVDEVRSDLRSLSMAIEDLREVVRKLKDQVSK